jgi:DNA-binding protein H-NS
MSVRIDKKLNKLSEKLAQLQQEMQALEAQKNAKLSIDSEEIQSIVNSIESLAKKNNERFSTIAALVQKACRTETTTETSIKKQSTLAPKYRDPMEYNNTWTGRGIAPLWLQRYISNGRNKNEFLIQ